MRKGVKRFFLFQNPFHFYSIKEKKYFVKHFRFKRKGFSVATRGQKLQMDLLKQRKNIKLHCYFDVDSHNLHGSLFLDYNLCGSHHHF